MIKGINKQIIEIKCVNDEYFDKVLLFVRSDKSGVPSGILRKEADSFCGKILPSQLRCARRGCATALRIAVLIALLAIAAALMVYLISFCI
jgi:hypothetical protein